MFGMCFKSICPNCGGKHNVYLGACTAYYTVNDSEMEYTPYTCPICDKSYWFAHGYSFALGTRKRTAADKVEAQGITCW